MLSNYQDVTTQFNLNNAVVLDISGWDYTVIQFVGPSGTIAVTASNDGGGLAGSTTGGPATATNFTTVQITKLLDTTAVSTVATAGMYRAAVVGRYLKLGGASAAATSVLVMFFKIA
jgi:hypothetical protein